MDSSIRTELAVVSVETNVLGKDMLPEMAMLDGREWTVRTGQGFLHRMFRHHMGPHIVCSYGTVRAKGARIRFHFKVLEANVVLKMRDVGGLEVTARARIWLNPVVLHLQQKSRMLIHSILSVVSTTQPTILQTLCNSFIF